MGPEGRVPLNTKVVYSLGQTGESVVGAGLGLLLIYYNQALGIPASLASLALGISVVWDAFVDPSVGSWSDGLQSKRWGRRHLSMLMSIAPIAVCYYFLMWPPEQMGDIATFVWLTVFAIATRTALSFFHVPFLSLGAEMSQDYQERTRIVAVRTFVGMASALLMIWVTWGYFFKSHPGEPAPQLVRGNYFDFAVAGAIAMAVLCLASTLGTMKTIPHLAGALQKPRKFSVKQVFQDLLEALRNDSFRALFLGTLIFTIYTGTQRAMSVHLQTFFWQLDTAGIKYIQTAFPIGGMIGVFFTGKISQILDKKWTVIWGCILSSLFGTLPVFLRTIGLFPFTGQELVWILVVLDFFVAFLGMQAGVVVGSMMGDIADEHEFKHGTRQEGIYFGASSLSGKMSSGLSVVIAGIFIDMIGLVPGSDPSAVPLGVLTSFGWTYSLVALIQIFSTWIFLPYSLNSARHAEIATELKRRRESGAAARASAAGEGTGTLNEGSPAG